MLWSIDSCQNKVPLTSIAWPYHGLRCRPILVEYFFEVIRWQVTSFQMITGSKFISNMLSLCHYGPAGRENSATYLKMQAGKTDVFLFSHHSHVLITLHDQFLCPEWSKFYRWVHVENSYSILKLVCFDSWSWQSFVTTCDVFNCLFPLDVQNEIQLLSRVFCYSWLVSLLNFWLRNVLLVKVRNPISDVIIFFFSPCWMCKRFRPCLIAFRSCISKSCKPE